MVMKTTIQRIKVEIEYLRALSEMYAESRDCHARQAALDAVDSLIALLRVIETSPNGERESLPTAA
jgi:hypothetical protein